MSSRWMPEIYSEIPEEFERINDEQWKQHRNIHREIQTLYDPEEDVMATEEYVYACETRILSDKEYSELQNTLYTPAQEETTDNQTTLMEALAEIYEMLTALMPEEEENDG